MEEINKSRKESRSIVTAPVSAEQVCFPLAEQAALLLRQTEGRKDELAALITSAEPSRLDAINWLGLNRDHWGIESGLHQRLDIPQRRPLSGAQRQRDISSRNDAAPKQ